MPGTSVFGKPLIPEAGEDMALPAGENIEVNGNETKMIAGRAGYLYRQNYLIHIGSLYRVRGDVCFKSGNIDYGGDVLIQGNVRSDFRVAADGNITVEGTVEAAEITSRNGSVIVQGSVFGKGKARITAAQNIVLDIAQDCFLFAGADVKVRGYLRGSHVEAKRFFATDSGCEVSSS
jgi:uncharacterized protein (DUF342 family)